MSNLNDYLKAVYIDTKKGVVGYLKSQLILMLVTFIILVIGLKYIGIEYSVLKSLGIAIVDAVPVVGSGIIMIPWAIYYLVIGVKTTAFQLAVLYVIATVLKQLIQPKIVGDKIGLGPLYTLILTIAGSMIIGPLGVILGPIIGVLVSSLLKFRHILNLNSRNKNQNDDFEVFQDRKLK